MKKIFALSLLSIFVIACKDEPKEPEPTGYPTDGLSLEAKQRTMVFFSYTNSNSAVTNFEKFRLMTEDFYEDDLDFMTVVFDNNSYLHSEASDSIADELALSFPPEFFVNTYPVLLTEFFDELDTKISSGKRPVASVAHKATRTDSGWIVDNKVKFWRDTLAEDFFVETYFLANVPAVNYSAQNLDLRMPAVNGLIANTDSISTWDADVPSALDTTNVVVSQGTEYVHPYILLDSYTENSIYGTRISEYNPFEFFFSANDIIGTRYTPIRHFFYRPGFDADVYANITYEFEPVFLSIIWSKNAMTGEVDYINSYMSTAKF